MDNMRNCTKCSHEKEEECGWVIAMGYVPWQNLENVNEPAKALRTGTLFPELEKPFLAHPTARKGGR